MRDVSTQLDMTGSVLKDRRTVWMIAAISFLLFLMGNLPWQLDDYDQAKQAFTSFEMIKEGHWLCQRTPRERVATKPPLVGWISAGLFVTTRSWELAWRLPSLLAAIALAILLFRAVSDAYGSIAGLVAISALGLNLLTPRLATLLRTDMLLALVIFLIGLLIWEKIQKREEWKSRDRGYLFTLLTIAMLIKGPIVYAFLLRGMGVFEWWRRRCPGRHGEVVSEGDDPGQHPRSRMSASAWPGWWPYVASLAVFLLWLTGGILFQPRFFNEVVMREFLARFGETIHRPQPLYFYLPHLLHKFAPWSILLIGIAIFDLVSSRWTIGAAFRAISPATFWLLCWSLGGLIVMSLIPSKRVDRIFPVVPPFCLLLAAQVSAAIRTVRRTNRSSPASVAAWQFCLAVVLLLAIFFSSAYATWNVVTGYRDQRDTLAIFGRNVRREAQAHHWRYEIVSSNDEGLLLYLQRTHYIEPGRAAGEWNNGKLNALVASTEEAARLIPSLRGATASLLKSNWRN